MSARSASTLSVIVGTLGFAILLATAQTPPSESQAASGLPQPSFGWVDVYIDSEDAPLAAYQFELAAESGDFKIVGIEGGEHAAFSAPPYYDPAALQHDRVIIAAFSTADELPTGRTRVVRVHVMVEGDAPQYVATLAVAATADGSRIPVSIQLEEGNLP